MGYAPGASYPALVDVWGIFPRPTVPNVSTNLSFSSVLYGGYPNSTSKPVHRRPRRIGQMGVSSVSVLYYSARLLPYAAPRYNIHSNPSNSILICNSPVGQGDFAGERGEIRQNREETEGEGRKNGERRQERKGEASHKLESILSEKVVHEEGRFTYVWENILKNFTKNEVQAFEKNAMQYFNMDSLELVMILMPVGIMLGISNSIIYLFQHAMKKRTTVGQVSGNTVAMLLNWNVLSKMHGDWVIEDEDMEEFEAQQISITNQLAVGHL